MRYTITARGERGQRFPGADEVVAHLLAIGYEDNRPKEWVGAELAVHRGGDDNHLLVGEPLKARYHRIDCDSKADLNELRGQMRKAGL